MVIQAYLSTEEVAPVFDQTVSDNRLFAWMQQQYMTRGTTSGGSTDFIVPNSGLNTSNKFIIDTDTTIVKELWIQMGTSQDGTDEPVRTWNYLINLEEIKISPEQSVFQQIKGMGQSIP